MASDSYTDNLPRGVAADSTELPLIDRGWDSDGDAHSPQLLI